MRCEAIMITQPEPGARCDAPAKHTFAGRAVCWTHLMACRGPRADSNFPVEFVKRREVKERIDA